MHRRQLDAEKLLLETAPDGVFFVALARQESTASYLCYYAVAKDPKDPRKEFEWRVAEIGYEVMQRHPATFWEGHGRVEFGCPSAFPMAHTWVEKQGAAIEPLEDLLVIARRHTEFFEKCAKEFEWDVALTSTCFNLLPHEMRGRIEIAKEMLSESLNAAKTVS